MKTRIVILPKTSGIAINRLNDAMIEFFRNFSKNDKTDAYHAYKYDNNIEAKDLLSEKDSIEKDMGKLSLCDSFAVAIGCGYKSIGKKITSIIELIFKYYENLIAVVYFSFIRIFHFGFDLVERYYLAVAASHPATLDNTVGKTD